MTIIDDRTVGQGGDTFAQVGIGQTCIINGTRWLKIGHDGANILKLADLSTGHADASTPVADVTSATLHLEAV